MATATPTPNGPLKVDNVAILDANGDEVKPAGTHFLCRCGHSANKPFCDGSHSKAAFVA